MRKIHVILFYRTSGSGGDRFKKVYAQWTTGEGHHNGSTRAFNSGEHKSVNKQ